jgi:hypothetical protein
MGYIHVKAKVSFRCIVQDEVALVLVANFVQSLCFYSIMDKEDILEILLMSIDSKYKVS